MTSIYSSLSNTKLLSGNYALKFLFVGFLGIHVPLIGVIIALTSGYNSGTAIFFTTLGCTLVACALTLYLLHALLAPIRASNKALTNYLTKNEVPQLPQNYNDDAGKLMQQIQQLTERLEAAKKA